MEMRGVEPLSENPSIRTSTIIAYYLSSLTQSRVGTLEGLVASGVFPGGEAAGQEVPRIVDAGDRVCRSPRANGRYLSSGELIIIVVCF